MNRTGIVTLTEYAKEGYKLQHDGKTIWGGLGNRSGLHSYADTVLREKFEKSGARLEKKLTTLKGKVTVFDFRNINRDRGRWVEVNEIKL